MKYFELIREGSAKNLLYIDDKDLAFRFLDWISVFDVGRCFEIPGKAEAICSVVMKSAEVARTVGVSTAILEQIDEVTIRVRKASVIANRPINAQDTDCIIPAEWISRFRVAGSLLRKLKDGKVKPTEIGFPTDDIPVEGTPLPYPINHFTTKWEKTDREISHKEACELCGLTVEEEAHCWAMGNVLDGALASIWRQAGFVRLDRKYEYLRLGPNREIVIGDVFGTQDEDRPVDLLALKKGKVEHYSKEYVRQVLIANGYKAKLDTARDAGESDPPPPDLSEEELAEVSRRYRYFADAYCAVSI